MTQKYLRTEAYDGHDRRIAEDPLYFGFFALEGIERRWAPLLKAGPVQKTKEKIRDFSEIMKDLTIVLGGLGTHRIGDELLPC